MADHDVFVILSAAKDRPGDSDPVNDPSLRSG
jgi:hypothetical protein